MNDNSLQIIFFIIVIALFAIPLTYVWLFIFNLFFKKRLDSYLKNRFWFAIFFYLNSAYIFWQEPKYIFDKVPIVWFFASLCLLEPIISKINKNFSLNLDNYFVITGASGGGVALNLNKQAPKSPKKRLSSLIIFFGHSFAMIYLVAYDFHLLLNQLIIILNDN